VTLDGGSITGTGILTSTAGFDMKSGSVSVVLAGAGIALDKTTSGTVTLSRANMYTGMTTVTGGTLKNTSATYIGHDSGSSGSAAVTGPGSTWENSSNFYVGYLGHGTVNVSGGATLRTGAQDYSYLGYDARATGDVTLRDPGSTWDCKSWLHVGHDGTGTLIIENSASLNTAYGIAAYIGYSAGSMGNVTVNGLGSTWTAEGLGVGHYGVGLLDILNGGRVTSGNSSVTSRSGTSVATVSGAGSLWKTTSDLTVGSYNGSGVLNIRGGGTVDNSTWGYIAKHANSKGIVVIDGVGSAWQNNGPLYVGYDGSGELHVSGGGILNDTWSIIGYSSMATGLVTVDGAGSAWNNNIRLDIGDNSSWDSGKGTLCVTGGGVVTAAQSLRINNRSMLAIDIGHGSALTVYSGNGAAFSNNGTVRILAAADVAAGRYAPISVGAIGTMGTWSGDGVYQAVGGTWDTGSHQFAVSTATSGSSGIKIEDINLNSTQRVLVSDGNGWSVGASFLAQSSTIDFMAMAISGNALTSLQDAIATGEAVLSGWEFLADNYTVSETNPVYLSFKVGLGHSLDDLDLWHYTLTDRWHPYTASDLTYDGTYASFTVTSFSRYAVSGLAVPEPSAIVFLSIVAASFAWGWRQQKLAT
jgi:T5SS/PEP-CTERM-associated repeat protein/autotransporter-associated beta strand protein